MFGSVQVTVWKVVEASVEIGELLSSILRKHFYSLDIKFSVFPG